MSNRQIRLRHVPFRFLNLWLRDESFIEVVRNHWSADFAGDPFSLFHHKLKRVKKALTQWREWNVDILNDILPSNLVKHILCHIKSPKEICIEDKPCWMLESRGAFTMKTAWNYIRQEEDPNRIYRWIWTKGMPFKMAL
ncbi:hypothetical protein H5410_032255 [Solanum commersonii]|uniref:Uncharacterized protein n=1 Tax=Solanum commersonii TaxID=4109 RepID=A0A9J5YLM8_SOLCO|nr:hypothetical protein H5410_032255 [Solanum commersonii]